MADRLVLRGRPFLCQSEEAVDFHSRVTETGMLIGTLSYQAPEQVSAQEFSFASDIFSLGRVFYELLLGKSVYSSDSMASVVDKILNEAPIPPGDIRREVPASLNRLILRMLGKEVEARPSVDSGSCVYIQ